ncbi:MAG: DUF362 domain-containing protein [Thermodesulfovibrionales bacterium]
MSDNKGQLNRRDFLKKSGMAAILAVGSGVWGYLFYSKEPVREKEKKVFTFRDFTVESLKTYPDLAVSKGMDVEKIVRSVVDRLGGMGRFVKPGERVLVKPNASWDRQPEQAANTNPLVVSTIVKMCLEAKAKEVWVTDVTVNDAHRSFSRSGIESAVLRAGGMIKFPTSNDFVTTDLKGEVLKVWPVCRFFHEVDRLINVPIVKHHSLSKCTIAMKNLYGVIGGQRNLLHQDIYTSIADLATAIRPTLTIVDATRVLMRNGPTGGDPSDVYEYHTVAASTDIVAIETFALRFLGLKVDDIPSISIAEKRGVGTSRLRDLHIAEM